MIKTWPFFDGSISVIAQAIKSPRGQAGLNENGLEPKVVIDLKKSIAKFGIILDVATEQI